MAKIRNADGTTRELSDKELDELYTKYSSSDGNGDKEDDNAETKPRLPQPQGQAPNQAVNWKTIYSLAKELEDYEEKLASARARKHDILSGMRAAGANRNAMEEPLADATAEEMEYGTLIYNIVESPYGELALSTYRFRSLLEQVRSGEHFGHYASALRQSVRLELMRPSNEEEEGKIRQALTERAAGNRVQVPLAAAYKGNWYVPTEPRNKRQQALFMEINKLRWRAKQAREKENELAKSSDQDPV